MERSPVFSDFDVFCTDTGLCQLIFKHNTVMIVAQSSHQGGVRTQTDQSYKHIGTTPPGHQLLPSDKGKAVLPGKRFALEHDIHGSRTQAKNFFSHTCLTH
jgi:maltoporin